MILKQYKKLVNLIKSENRYLDLKKQREIEIEDDPETLQIKCLELTELIKKSKNIVIYTGAGISTSASIPDYRGPDGVWTRIKNKLDPQFMNDLVCTEPTYTHMAIVKLLQRKIIKHIVSQNCDGLHVRSGVPSRRLSEIHGNIFVEVCKNCDAHYIRSFDVTEKTAYRKHETGRNCHRCSPETGKLIDTIVHFGEKGKLRFPLNWEAASKAAEKSDLIICIGTSLKVLRKYACLWPKNKKYKLIIINLQWTPKDSQASIKINGKSDVVMKNLMVNLELSVDPYRREKDSILISSTPLRPEEEHTCNRIKMEQYFEDQIDFNKLSMRPSWFGKGIRKK
ncbi:chromatin regulatory protein sir2-like protein [Sarcoptes scabiei]|uniref:protein acetyllysine N-acetyltransferase n=1 Tax=Sarcoptes scabiei TaxID=52283 RepID=A0A132AB29_SARSC|nr:chromatin regulatory protein sir2-like protein [Sarcoptes scabiei]